MPEVVGDLAPQPAGLARAGIGVRGKDANVVDADVDGGSVLLRNTARGKGAERRGHAAMLRHARRCLWRGRWAEPHGERQL